MVKADLDFTSIERRLRMVCKYEDSCLCCAKFSIFPQFFLLRYSLWLYLHSPRCCEFLWRRLGEDRVSSERVEPFLFHLVRWGTLEILENSITRWMLWLETRVQCRQCCSSSWRHQGHRPESSPGSWWPPQTLRRILSSLCWSPLQCILWWLEVHFQLQHTTWWWSNSHWGLEKTNMKRCEINVILLVKSDQFSKTMKYLPWNV